MATELQELIYKLSQLIDSMSDTLKDSERSPSALHTLSRHRDLLTDYSKEFNKAKSNIQSNRNRAELMASVQRDIRSKHAYVCACRSLTTSKP
eukprot:m.238545 g.238545  ORF g.238545 m.238545 type:complete len:93 (+) comp54357_c0_seq8:459-737(+)